MNYYTATFEQIWEYEIQSYDKTLDWGLRENNLTGKFLDENINFIFYLKNNKLHRLDGPAAIKKNTNAPSYISWHTMHLNRHNIHGPAEIYYYNKEPYTTIIRKEWYMFGKLITEKEFNLVINNYPQNINGNEIIIL